MNISKSLEKNWLRESLFLALFWFPPIGVLTLYYVVQREKSLKEGDITQAVRHSSNARYWVENGIICGIGFLTIIAAYVFIKGGDLIPVLSSFY